MKIEDLPEGTLIADGWDEALIGYGWRLNTVIAVYDRAKILQKLMADSLTEDEADEYISFNIEGAYMGEGTPLLVTLRDDPDRDTIRRWLDEWVPHDPMPDHLAKNIAMFSPCTESRPCEPHAYLASDD